MSKSDSTEQYDAVKAKLTQQILRKQELDAKLSKLEDKIYEKENEYFAESAHGNIVKGFDNFTKANTGGSHKKRIAYTDDDHIFSLSSASFVKSFARKQGLTGKNDELDEYEDSVEPTNGGVVPPGANTTPSRKRKGRTMDE
ncbi:chromatin modification-related protein Eaf6p [[Candida] railenensis]|uniref:Chromatin modification-related protein EAF6 n=1 Tax=[Candida] railenensis TaxID=45579 RepID=A0A9P0QMR0_9ASCO|nr:chromatin modification-related protein Eaf6p [[Candida] railenensis]